VERDAGNQMEAAKMLYLSREMTGYAENGVVGGLNLPPQREAFDSWFNQLRSCDLLLINIQGVPGGMDKTSGECSLC